MKELNFNDSVDSSRDHVSRKKDESSRSRFGVGESGTFAGSWNQKSQEAAPPEIIIFREFSSWERNDAGTSTLSLPVDDPDNLEYF